MPRWSMVSPRMHSIMTMSPAFWVAIRRGRRQRRRSRSVSSLAAPGAILRWPMLSGSRPNAASRVACTSITTTRAGIRPRPWEFSARSPPRRRLLRLTQDQTATALGLAASLASGLKANFGTMTKPLHVGHTARNGLFAALMVQQGFTANPAALEARQGFLDVFNGPGTYDVDRILADWYAPLEVEGGGEPGLKPYPCCGSTHASINRMIHLARTRDLSPDCVAKIEIMPHARRLPHTNNPDPCTPLGEIQHPVRGRARPGRPRGAPRAFRGRGNFDPVICGT